MRGAWRALRRFWESDRGLSLFLGLLIVFLFVLPPLVEPEGHGRSLIGDLGLSVLLLAGVAAVSPHRAVRALLFVLVVGALVVRWGPFSAPATAAAALVTVVAMTGQLYPAILLARLVSLATSRGPAGPGQAAPPPGFGQG